MADDVTRTPEEGGRIVEEPIGEALSKRYLAYALSTITSPGAAGCARRPEAGAAAHPLRHARLNLDPEGGYPQVRQGRRRCDG
jgi:hypothetical protein